MFGKWVELKRLSDNKHASYKTAYIRTDNEFVYTSNKWIDHCKGEGGTRVLPTYVTVTSSTAWRTRHANYIGVSFRVMMIHGGALDADTADALLHANLIRNNTPTKTNQGWNPKEMEAGMKLGINERLRVLRAPLFCLELCYAAIYKEEPDYHRKQDPRGVRGVCVPWKRRQDLTI